jgi:integrase/recombinase XerD
MGYQYKQEPLTQEEAARLINACSSAIEKLVVWTLIDTGLKVSELAELKKENIDLQGRRLLIYGKTGSNVRGTKPRIVPISYRVLSVLENYFALNEVLGIGVRSMQLLVKKVANRAKINRPITPYVLRHTFSMLAIQKGISIRALQEILGQSNFLIPEKDLKLSPEDVVREFHEKWLA